VLTGEQPAPHATLADAAQSIDLMQRYAAMAAGIGWTRGVLDQAGLLATLVSLPAHLHLRLPNGATVLGVHASPLADDGLGIDPVIADDELGRLLTGSGADIVIGGHTHAAIDRMTCGIRALNPGSTGLPRTRGMASWLLLEADGDAMTPFTLPHGSNRSIVVAMGRFRSLGMIVIFDVAAPLVAYKLLRSHGFSAVNALLLGGVFPAVHVAAGAIRNRRLDVVGALVLAGIALGTVTGLISHSSRLLLIEGSVPTVIFGVACLVSLCTPRPLMYRLALEFTGPDTARGREMTGLWKYDGFRRVFTVITWVWGLAFFIEAALRVVVVYSTSAGTALAISSATPFIWAGVLCAWTVGYGTWRRKKGERQAAAAGFTIDASTEQLDAASPQ
jgi:hypothetical protein